MEKEVIFEVETGVHRTSGLAKITIPNSILREIEENGENEIFKLSIPDKNIELFFEYRGIGRVEIVSKFIEHGKHRISIKPYSIEDFIKEFNDRITGKFNVNLHIDNEKLILNIGREKLPTSRWRFYKEAGGGVAVQAEYPSSRRRNKKIFIKYQIKMGGAFIYLLEPQGSRKRLSTQKIVDIEYDGSKGRILFRYKHGDRVKTTSADLSPKLKSESRGDREESELLWRGDLCEVVIKTKLRRGKHYELIIPWRIFEKLRSRYKTDIYKLVIKGENLVTEHIWRLSRKGEQEISIKGLTEGTYKVLIKPYTVVDFIQEFNVFADDRYGVKLNIEKDVLTLYIGEKTLKTVKWIFDKEFGGGACIKAVYPSKTRANKEIIMKYQVKRGIVNIWVLEPRRNRRSAVYPIEDIVEGEDRIDIVYRHGRRVKTTYIPLLI